MPAYNDFITRYKGTYEYAAFFDVDEFLVLKKHPNVKRLIKQFFTASVGGLAINWALFDSNGIKEYTPEPVVQRFIKRFGRPALPVKVIIRVNSAIQMQTPHAALLYRGFKTIDTNLRIIKGSGNPTGSDSVVQLNHYQIKSLEECLQRMAKGRASNGQSKNVKKCYRRYTGTTQDLHALHFYQKITGMPTPLPRSKPVAKPQQSKPVVLGSRKHNQQPRRRFAHSRTKLPRKNHALLRRQRLTRTIRSLK